jgi:hypothetical protein
VVASYMLGEDALGELHQVVDLGRVAPPDVVGRRHPRGDTADPGLRAPSQEQLQVFRAEAVTDADVVVPGSPSPAAVAVHRDRDVVRHRQSGQLPPQDPGVEAVERPHCSALDRTSARSNFTGSSSCS